MYKSLDQVIRDILGDEGDTLHLYPKYLKHGIQGVKEIAYDVHAKLLTRILAVNAVNHTAQLPDDFMRYVKIGVLGTDGHVHRLQLNNDLILFQNKDDCGEPIDMAIIGDNRAFPGADPTDEGYYFNNYISPDGATTGVLFGWGGAHNPVGYYRINQEVGQIQLDSDFAGTQLVLEYLTNGVVKNERTMVHEWSVPAITAYVIWKVNWRKKSTPGGEKQMYEKAFEREVLKLQYRKGASTEQEILDSMRLHYKQTPKS